MRAFLFVVAFVFALPFGVGAVVLAGQYIVLPDSAGSLVRAQLLGAALSVFGFWIGLIGTSIAFLAQPTWCKKLATSLVLFGCAHIALGVLMRKYVEGTIYAQELSLRLFLIPLVLWASAIIYAFRTSISSKSRDERSTEEQPPPPLQS